MMLAKLILAHLLADYALQGDFMAKAKNHKAPFPGVPWQTVLASHAAIHALLVLLITGSALFAAIEFVVHAATDWAKCDGRISFNTDQAVHLLTKVAFAVCLWVSP